MFLDLGDWIFLDDTSVRLGYYSPVESHVEANPEMSKDCSLVLYLISNFTLLLITSSLASEVFQTILVSHILIFNIKLAKYLTPKTRHEIPLPCSNTYRHALSVTKFLFNCEVVTSREGAEEKKRHQKRLVRLPSG